jgi:hypothetical protein
MSSFGSHPQTASTASVASLPDLVFRNKMQFLQILSDDAPRPFTDLEKRAERTTSPANGSGAIPAKNRPPR